MTEDKIEAVKDLQYELEKIKENSLTRSGLSKVDSLELKTLLKEQKQAKADGTTFSPRKARRIRELFKEKDYC